MLMSHLVGCIPMMHIVLVHIIWKMWLDVLTQQHSLIPMQHLHKREQGAKSDASLDVCEVSVYLDQRMQNAQKLFHSSVV